MPPFIWYIKIDYFGILDPYFWLTAILLIQIGIHIYIKSKSKHDWILSLFLFYFNSQPKTDWLSDYVLFLCHFLNVLKIDVFIKRYICSKIKRLQVFPWIGTKNLNFLMTHTHTRCNKMSTGIILYINMIYIYINYTKILSVLV